MRLGQRERPGDRPGRPACGGEGGRVKRMNSIPRGEMRGGRLRAGNWVATLSYPDPDPARRRWLRPGRVTTLPRGARPRADGAWEQGSAVRPVASIAPRQAHGQFRTPPTTRSTGQVRQTRPRLHETSPRCRVTSARSIRLARFRHRAARGSWGHRRGLPNAKVIRRHGRLEDPLVAATQDESASREYTNIVRTLYNRRDDPLSSRRPARARRVERVDESRRDMPPFRWSNRSELAAQLVAADELTNDQIADRCGVSRPALQKWKARPEFMARVDEHLEAYRQAVLRHGVAVLERRVAALDERWRHLRRIIDERAASPAHARRARRDDRPARPHGQGAGQRRLLPGGRRVHAWIAGSSASSASTRSRPPASSASGRRGGRSAGTRPGRSSTVTPSSAC